MLQEKDRSSYYSQTAFALALGLLDDDPASPVNSQELTSGQGQERTVSPGLANRLSLSLDESQDGQATAGRIFSNTTMKVRMMRMARMAFRQSSM